MGPTREILKLARWVHLARGKPIKTQNLLHLARSQIDNTKFCPCRRLLFPLLHAEKVPFPRATKEIGDVCTQATLIRHLLNRDSYLLIYIRHNYYV